MTTPNQAQLDNWNGDSGQRWSSEADQRDEVLAPVADTLLAAAALRPGESLLDVGCGCGVTTVAAAHAVQPAEVVGIDLSQPMLAVARQRATGLTNTAFLQADAQTHTFTPDQFDVVISRFGTMFFDDPAAAFTNIARAVRPGGRLCLATWQPLAANDWLTIPGAALLRYGNLPDLPTDAPGMFAQSDPDTVTDVLHRARYRHIDAQPVTLSLRLGADATDATEYLAATGVGRAVLDTVPDDQRPVALAAVTAALVDHANDSGVHLSAAIWIIGATLAP